MKAINYPAGLIRYTSQRQLSGQKNRIFKLKNIGYAIALLVVSSLLTWSILHRTTTELRVQQIRQPLYVHLSDGSIQNRYMVKVFNKRDEEMSYELALQERPGFSWQFSPSAQLTLPASKSAEIQLIVRADITYKHVSNENVTVRMTYFEDGIKKEITAKSSFYFPDQSD